MNSIIMITYVAGTVLSQATFATMEECRNARKDILQQSTTVEAFCLYSEKKEDIDPRKLLEAFMSVMPKDSQ
jgi:hypothetical protein